MKNKCVYPGSFDPPTFGHLDIIGRASNIFDEVHVAVLNNTSKKQMFSLEDRIFVLTRETEPFGNVHVHSFDGLLVDFLEQTGIDVVVRGVRNNTDLDLEDQMANTNRILKPDMETVLLIANPKMNYLSSSIIKELILLGADVSSFVPKSVVQLVKGRK